MSSVAEITIVTVPDDVAAAATGVATGVAAATIAKDLLPFEDTVKVVPEPSLATLPLSPIITPAKVFTCGYNCICTKKDCVLKHSLKTIEERKFASHIYNFIPDLHDHIKEENPETRKLNCFNGQLCRKPECGFRHFLDIEGRNKFNLAMNVASYATSKKTPLSEAERTSEMTQLQKRVKELEEKMEMLLAAK